jgi:hypothetical protein
VSNEFDNSIRATPIRWTEECWKEVYHFSAGGGGLAGRKDKYVKDCFKDLPSPKDGYAIEDCKDSRHRRLLAFLDSIVYPVRCSAIEGILHRYHSCGPMLVLKEVAHDWHLGYLGALGLLGAIR